MPQSEPFDHHRSRQRDHSRSSRLREQFEICIRHAVFNRRRNPAAHRRQRGTDRVGSPGHGLLVGSSCLERFRFIWTTWFARSFHQRRPTVRIVVLRLRLGGAGRTAGHGGSLHAGQQRQTRSSGRNHADGAKSLMNSPIQTSRSEAIRDARLFTLADAAADTAADAGIDGCSRTHPRIPPASTRC